MTGRPTDAPTTAVTAPPADVPTARQMRVRLRRARRRHHPRSIGDLLTDAYILVLFVAMYGWAFIDTGRGYLDSPAGKAADPGARYWIAVAVALAAAGLAWQGLRSLGPLLVTPATQAWAASTPIDRRAWLLPRFGVLIVATAFAGAVLGLSAAAIGGGDGVPVLGGAALAGATCGAGGAALSVVAQGSRHRHRWPRLLGAGLTGAGAMVAIVVIGAHFLDGRLLRPTVPLTVALAVVGVPAAVTAVAFAARALPRLDRATLTTGAQFANAATAAAVMLDPSLLTGLIESRRWRGIGRVHSRRFLPGGRWWVLLQAEVRRLYRHPSSIPTWGALALVQYAVAVALPSLAGPAQVIGAYLATGRFTGGLRTLNGAPGLRRTLGGDDTWLRLVHIVAPTIAAALWWLVTTPVGGAQPGWVEALLVLAVVAAAYRNATRPPMTYGGAVADTPLGMIPVDLLRQVIRGPDLLAVAVVAQILLA